jgi:hypothetical protein
MKTHLSKKTLWRLMLSALTLGVFILLAMGTSSMEDLWADLGVDVIIYPKRELGNGVFESTEHHALNGTARTKITTGTQDGHGRWHGPVTIEWTGGSKEEVRMAYGRRQGLSTITHPDGKKEEKHYFDGRCYEFKKAAHQIGEGTTSYQVLTGKYPFYPFTLNLFGFEDAYVEAYLDTLETILYTYEFDASEFDSYYEDALDVLEETPYDSIIVVQSNLFILQGLEEMKNAELRLAVIDRYRSEAGSTFDVVNSVYPEYLHMLNDSGVADPDFEQFCQDLDDTLATYGSLDPEDPFFTDSVDARLFRALFAIMELNELSASGSKQQKKSAALAYGRFYANDIKDRINSVSGLRSVKAGSGEVAGAIVSGMLMHFIRGDIIRLAVREAYMINQGIIRTPVPATEFAGNNSATSVTLQGYVLEDGGAAVTSRGIAWASVYNPTTGDNTEESGTGTGDFTVTLTGLTEGTKYYARTYATNSAGTAYGNCIEFVAQTPTVIQDIKLFARDFTVYPNPARASVTCSFRLGSPGSMALTITDMKGQQVFYRDLGMLPRGESRITLDLSGLGNGLYNCRLSNGTEHVVQKLEIVR